MKINWMNAVTCTLTCLVIELAVLLITGSYGWMWVSCVVAGLTFGACGFKIVEDKEDKT